MSEQFLPTTGACKACGNASDGSDPDCQRCGAPLADYVGNVEPSPLEVGDRITRQAVNGHTFEYRVTGFYADGTPRTTQYDAWHSERCRCATWEGEDQRVPDW